MNDRLILSPVADDSEADAIVRSRQLADLASRDAQLTRIEQDVEKLSKLTKLTDTQQAQYAAIKDEHKNVLAQRDRLLAEQRAHQERGAAKGKSRHVAHETAEWRAVCTAPDLCRVGKSVIAFDSIGLLDQQQIASPNVKARGTPVYRQGDLFKVVLADAGSHIVAGTSLGSGYVKILDGHSNVKVNGLPVARQDSRCLVNCNAAGVGGAPGRLVTVQKSASGTPGAGAEAAGGADLPPPGQRTSEKLDALKQQKAALEQQLIDFDAADSVVDFETSNQMLDDAIGQIQGTKGTWTDVAAQGTRGLLGFGKDLVMGIGNLAYEGAKAVPKLMQRSHTAAGQLLTQIDAQILAENIRLGNITPGTVGQGALNIGSALIKPVTDPWQAGNYVEAVTRGTAEVATLFGGTIAKAGKLGEAAKAGEVADAAKASEVAEAAKAAEVAEATKVAEAAKAGDVADGAKAAEGAKTATAADTAKGGEAAKGGDGVHVKRMLTPAERARLEADLVENLTADIKNNPLRAEYEDKVAELKKYSDQIKPNMTDAELKQLAEEAHAARRNLGIEYKNLTPEPLRDFIYEVNKSRYGDPLGPTIDHLVKTGKSYEDIIRSAARPNPDVNKLLGKFSEWLSKQDDSYIIKHGGI